MPERFRGELLTMGRHTNVTKRPVMPENIEKCPDSQFWELQKWSWTRFQVRISPKTLYIFQWTNGYYSRQFSSNPSLTSWDVLRTDRQTDRQTPIITIRWRQHTQLCISTNSETECKFERSQSRNSHGRFASNGVQMYNQQIQTPNMCMLSQKH